MLHEFIHDIKFLLNVREYFNVDRRWPDNDDLAAGQRVYREGITKRDLVANYIIEWFIVLFVTALFLSIPILLVLALLGILK